MLFHRTIQRSFNLLNVISGDFISKSEKRFNSFVFNLNTYFELYTLNEEKNVLKYIIRQPFFSKVRCICKGPRNNSKAIDTFYAVRAHDILRFQFSEEERIFIATEKIKLPSLCNSPDFIFYSSKNNTMFVSCCHGGMCGIQFNTCDDADGLSEAKNNYNVIFVEKNCNVVIQAFSINQDIVARMEHMKTLTLYNTKTFSKEMELSIAFDCVFPVGENALGLFWNSNEKKTQGIKFVNLKNEELSNYVFGQDMILKSPNFRWSSVPLENNSTLLSIDSNFVLIDNINFNVKIYTNSPSMMISKIFNIKFPIILLMNCSSVFIYNVQNQFPKTTFKKFIGTKKLVAFPGSFNNDKYFINRLITHNLNSLIFINWGHATSIRPYLNFQEQILGIFATPTFKHFAISFQSETKFYDLQKYKFDEIKSISSQNNGKAIGIEQSIQNGNLQTYFFTQNGIYDMETGKFLQKQITHVVTSDKYLICAYSGDQSTDFFVKSDVFDAKFSIKGCKLTAMAIAPPNYSVDGLDFLVISCINFMNKSLILIIPITNDEAKRSTIIEMNMFSKVYSLGFLKFLTSPTSDNKELNTKLIVGMINHLIIADIDTKNCTFNIIRFVTLGEGPIYFKIPTYINPKTLKQEYYYSLIAVCNKTWLINFGNFEKNENIFISQINMDTCNFVLYPFHQHGPQLPCSRFVASRDKQLYCGIYDLNNEINVTYYPDFEKTIKEPLAPIVGFHVFKRVDFNRNCFILLCRCNSISLISQKYRVKY